MQDPDPGLIPGLGRSTGEGIRLPIPVFLGFPYDSAGKESASNVGQILKTQQWPQDWKRSVFIPVPKKGNAKEYSNYHTIALISH